MHEEEDEDDHDHYGDSIHDFICTGGHWLDYKIKQEFSNNTPPARLVRFMPIEQYLSILTTKQLYIPRATEYDDPYDCAFPGGSLADAICRQLVQSCDEPEFSIPSDADPASFVEKAEAELAEQLEDKFADEVPERWFVSCWHAGETLTDLMWRSYGGHKGVCISVDGPKFLQQLQSTIWVRRYPTEPPGQHFTFLYGYVNYEQPVFEVEPGDAAEGEGPTVTVRHPAFHKHNFFRLDEEYRFAARLTAPNPQYYSAGANLDLIACNAIVSASPLCPLWIAKSVEAITRQFYPSIEFKHLSLEQE